jgi:hypothetical protein
VNDPKLSPLSDPENVDLRVVDDEPDEEQGMTPEEADEFLARPTTPAREEPPR